MWCFLHRWLQILTFVQGCPEPNLSTRLQTPPPSHESNSNHWNEKSSMLNLHWNEKSSMLNLWAILLPQIWEYLSSKKSQFLVIQNECFQYESIWPLFVTKLLLDFQIYRWMVTIQCLFQIHNVLHQFLMVAVQLPSSHPYLKVSRV